MKAQHFSVVVLVGLGAALVLLFGHSVISNQTQQSASTAEYQQTTDANRRFGKREYLRYVEGMTKAEIRETFGSPDVVYDRENFWLYNELPVYDEDAGTHALVKIHFKQEFEKPDVVETVVFL